MLNLSLNFQNIYYIINMPKRLSLKYDMELLEMSNLQTDFTGLPVNIWIDDVGKWKLSKHGPRIKFQNDKGNKVNIRPNSSLSIKIHNSELVDKRNECTLSSQEIKTLQDFVTRYKEDLMALAVKPNTNKFLELTKKIEQDRETSIKNKTKWP